MTKQLAAIMVVMLGGLCSVPMAFGIDESAEKAAIENRIESYTAAFNAGDAKTLAAHWMPGAVYINPRSRRQVEGRKAIAKEFTAVLSELKDAKLTVNVDSIRFVSPNVAVESGIAQLLT